jgi:hypothetical protein
MMMMMTWTFRHLSFEDGFDTAQLIRLMAFDAAHRAGSICWEWTMGIILVVIEHILLSLLFL